MTMHGMRRRSRRFCIALYELPPKLLHVYVCLMTPNGCGKGIAARCQNASSAESDAATCRFPP